MQKRKTEKRKKERKLGNQIFNFNQDTFCEFGHCIPL